MTKQACGLLNKHTLQDLKKWRGKKTKLSNSNPITLQNKTPKTKTFTQRLTILWLVVFLFIAVPFVWQEARPVMVAWADESDEEDRGDEDDDDDEEEEEEEEKNEELEELEEKAEKYQKIIDQKQKQKATLENQMQMMEAQIERIGNDVEITKKEIIRNKSEVEQLEAKIEIRTTELEEKKDGLKEVIQLYYQTETDFDLEIMANQNNIGVVLDQFEYMEQISDQLGRVMKEIEVKMRELEKEKQVFEKKNEELGEKEEELEDKISHLDSEKVGKQLLWQETNGEEAKYQEKLARVEEQKQALLGDVGAYQGEISDILAEAKKPSSKYHASSGWYYSQKDSRWAYDRIGKSSSLMKDYGCAISSVAMVFTYHGEKITAGKLARKDIFYYDLIVWPRSWSGGIKLVSGISHGNISWKEVDKQIKNGNPVIVFIKSTKSSGGHYVVIHHKDKTDYVVHDPLFGKNIYLKTTRKIVGAIYGSGTEIDQMIIYNED